MKEQLEEAGPKNRIEELEQARSRLVDAQRHLSEVDDHVGKALRGLRACDDRADGFYWFLDLLSLELAENLVRLIRKDVRSRRFVDAAAEQLR